MSDGQKAIAAPSASGTKPPLLSIPQELRDEIYIHLFLSPTGYIFLDSGLRKDFRGRLTSEHNGV